MVDSLDTWFDVLIDEKIAGQEVAGIHSFLPTFSTNCCTSAPLLLNQYYNVTHLRT
jgi:hypothetical protein